MKPDPLEQALAAERSRSLLRQAWVVRDAADGPERARAAQDLIREAFVACATGRITLETESMIYTVLSFAMPEEPPSPDAGPQAAYAQQLERRSCPECGDGHCPFGDE